MPTGAPTAVLAVLHTAAEVARLPRASGLRIVAASPAACLALERAGVEATRIDEALADDAWGRLYAETAAPTERWIETVDAVLGEHIPSFRDEGFRPAVLDRYLLRYQIDTLRVGRSLLEAALADGRPGRIVAGRYEFDDDPLWWRPHLLAGLLERWAGVHGVPWEATLPLPAESPFRRAPGAASWRAGAGVWLRRLLATMRRIRRRRSPSVRDRIVFACGDEGSGLIASVAGDLAAGWPPRPAPPARPSGIEGAWAALRETPETWEILDDADLLRPFLEPRLRRWVVERVPALWGAYRLAVETFGRERPRAIVGAAQWGEPRAAAAEAAGRRLGIPVVLAPHNPLLSHGRQLVYGECIPGRYDRLLAGGPAEARFWEAKGIAGLRVRDCGLARLDACRPRTPSYFHRLRESLRGGDPRPVVLYVPVSYLDAWRTLDGFTAPDTWSFSIQARALRLFREHPAVRLCFKPFPSSHVEDPLPDLVREEIPGAIVVEAPVARLVHAVDAVVIDHAQTALFEALLSPAPILLLADRRWTPLEPEAARLLRRRVLLYEDGEAFLAGLREFLAAGRFEPLAGADDSFLRAYGVSAGDGRSAERALRAILEA